VFNIDLFIVSEAGEISNSPTIWGKNNYIVFGVKEILTGDKLEAVEVTIWKEKIQTTAEIEQ